MIEIGARVRASDTEIEDVNHEGTSTPGSFVTIEGFSRGDPRFVSDRVRAQVPIPEALFTSSKPVAIITRGLAHELRSAGSLTISVNRTVGGESETLTLDIAVLGVTHSDTRRLFMGSRVVQALDNWSAGGTFEPDISEPSSLRALLFAERARDVETVVASLEAAGWRVQHRLRDVQSLQRTRRLIYAVSALACSGYLLAGFIAAAVYVASTRRQARVNAAVLKLCGVTPVASGIILIVPLMLAAIMGFVVSVIVASFAASRLSGLVGPLLGVELSLQASGMGFGVILLVATTTMLPLVSGLAWSFLNCWRAPIRDSLCSPGQC